MRRSCRYVASAAARCVMGLTRSANQALTNGRLVDVSVHGALVECRASHFKRDMPVFLRFGEVEVEAKVACVRRTLRGLLTGRRVVAVDVPDWPMDLFSRLAFYDAGIFPIDPDELEDYRTRPVPRRRWLARVLP